ncbi:MAG: hypothetical protein K2N81_01850 [Acetatifactor sp.]|nr:hypothetical protein [Acetatifactor sp.]
MKKKRFLNLTSREFPVIILYFSLYFIIGLSLLFRQPFGDPPDEFNRYLIPQYIAQHGTLPNGYDESIRISSYGFSYAFQPILPYMVQGYCMRMVQFFTQDQDILVYSARMVNFVFGLLMAVFVLLLGQKWFADKRLQYFFCFLTMFLPQSIFLHTYINTDSCCMMSVAIMLYGLTCCLENHFAYSSCTVMSIGIIFCALSYYNAYSFILSCMLLFIAHYLSFQNGKLRLDWKPFFRKGLFVSILVLAGIGWWFIRSYILYDGDILGLRTRAVCGALYGSENMRPDMRVTYKSLGYTIPTMLLKSDFPVLSINSFICTYGPMSIITALWIYRFYKLIFAAGILGNLIPSALLFRRGDQRRTAARPVLCIFFHANMLLCILVPCVLSIIYSYGTDCQPQGRYLMPALIPLCFYCVRGIDKGMHVLKVLCLRRKTDVEEESSSGRLFTFCYAALTLVIVAALCVTVYGYVFPYYAKV